MGTGGAGDCGRLGCGLRNHAGHADGCPARLRCSWELKALGDYHQHLLKMRLEGGLEGIEMGPILGRGSFGRVYKGTALLPSTCCHYIPRALPVCDRSPKRRCED